MISDVLSDVTQTEEVKTAAAVVAARPQEGRKVVGNV